MPVQTESQYDYQQETKVDDTMDPIPDGSVTDEASCANCGSKINENTDVCKSCGEARL